MEKPLSGLLKYSLYWATLWCSLMSKEEVLSKMTKGLDIPTLCSGEIKLG